MAWYWILLISVGTTLLVGFMMFGAWALCRVSALSEQASEESKARACRMERYEELLSSDISDLAKWVIRDTIAADANGWGDEPMVITAKFHAIAKSILSEFTDEDCDKYALSRGVTQSEIDSSRCSPQEMAETVVVNELKKAWFDLCWKRLKDEESVVA